MRIFILFITGLLFCISVKGQTVYTNNKEEVVPKFANQGEQENYWAKKLFDERYTPQSFERFKGKVVVIGRDSIKFDTVILEVGIYDKALKTIFEKGIFYPGILDYGHTEITLRNYGAMSHFDKADTEKSSIRSKRILNYSISNLEEIKFISDSRHTKKFRFWLRDKKVLNPEVCFFELTNDKATEQTDLATFIDGSKLTFFAHGWIII
jgi:hypothetical protein